MRIAQITDPHVTPAAGAYDPAAALGAVLARVAALDPPPDLVVFSGDLAENGRPEDYTRFREIVAGCDLPMLALPGNHDRRDAFVAGLAGSDVLIGTPPFLHLAIEDGPVRLIGLDTLAEGEAAGLLCEARLRWVAERLAADDDRPVMLFMHHPPFRIGQPVADSSNCRGGDALAAIVARHPRVARGRLRPRASGDAAGLGRHHRLDLSGGGLGGAARQPSERPFRLVPQRPGFQLHAWSEALGLVTHTFRLFGAP